MYFTGWKKMICVLIGSSCRENDVPNGSRLESVCDADNTKDAFPVRWIYVLFIFQIFQRDIVQRGEKDWRQESAQLSRQHEILDDEAHLK